MSDFIVSARKYRPETFKSVVGQGNITSTLKNAIRNNHLGHAYLFCGPRGVGKTTCARIFAKTINCAQPTVETEPCNECESCKAFNESRSYNIHELDAASNNSVDDIRSLTEQVRIPPQIGKYSVYIIDEVHMLSQSAFNAFLKTLEEPPAHAVFILATTEKHKIIPTILSRCQIFDFNRIKVDDAVKYLAHIASKESVEANMEALHIIAQKADGAMRDALSIFDQIVSFSGKKIEYQDVIDNLNILDYEYYFRITDSFLAGNVPEALLTFDEIIDKGFDGHNFINGLASHIRDLLVSTDQATIKLLEVSDSLRQRYLDQSRKCTPDFLFEALDKCNQTDIKYKESRNQRLLVELTLVKLASIVSEKKKPDHEQLNAPLPEDVGPAIKEKKEATLSETKKTIESSDSKILVPKIEKPIQDTHKKNVVSSGGISIKDAISGEKSEPIKNLDQAPHEDVQYELTEEYSEIEDYDFSSDEMLKAWNQYAEMIKTDKPRLYSTLITRHPILVDNYQIQLKFANTSQLEDFTNNIKQLLLNFLRRELSNNKVGFQTILEEADNGKRKLYTPDEKFNYLVKKNPTLGRLKQEFNLDFD